MKLRGRESAWMVVPSVVYGRVDLSLSENNRLQSE